MEENIDDRTLFMVKFLYHTGLRIKEACGLLQSDLNWQYGDKSRFPTAKIRLEITKSEAGIRDIYLS